MMHSEQLKGFDVTREPLALRRDYGDTLFGAACLAARRLIEVGVRCVEVTLDGWDSHANNHRIQRDQVAILDPGFAALIRDLKRHELLQRTVVLCRGIRADAEGQPSWGQGPLAQRFQPGHRRRHHQGGRVVGATDPEGREAPLTASAWKTFTPRC